MTRSHARAVQGVRAYAKKPSSHGGNLSMIGAVRLKHPFLVHSFDGPIDGERFLVFLDRLCPRLEPGDVLIMDNCRIHHIEAVRVKLEAVGAKALFLPPYSPELNPIEEVWSLVKRMLRSFEPRNIVEYVRDLLRAAAQVTHEKIESYFRHAQSFLGSQQAQST